VLLLLAACAGGPPKAPGFTIELTPRELRAGPGETVEFTVRVTPEPGFEGELTVILLDAPSGFTLQPDRLTVGSDPVTETFTLTLPESGEPLDLTIRIAFRAGGFEKTATLRVVVTLSAARWIPRASGTDVDFNHVVFLRGRFYALGGKSTVRVSEDGITWSDPGFNFPSADCDFMDLTSGSNFYVLVGRNPYSPCVFRSPDGVAWEAVRSSQDVTAVAAHKGTFVSTEGVRTIGYSDDQGETWIYASVGPPGATAQYSFMKDVFYLDAFVVLDQVGGIYLGHRPDDWSFGWELARAPDGSPTQAIVYGGDRFVVVGMGGLILTAESLRGEWQVVAPAGDERLNLYDVTHGAGTYVAVGKRCRILTSRDAQNWSPSDCPTEHLPDLRGVAYGKGRFVAVGQGGVIFSTP